MIGINTKLKTTLRLNKMRYIENAVGFLGVRLPVTIHIKNPRDRNIAAYHEGVYSKSGKLKAHKIVVNMGSVRVKGERNKKTLILHELVHAWQAENKKPRKHGKVFARKCAEVNMKFGVPRIFQPEIDID